MIPSTTYNAVENPIPEAVTRFILLSVEFYNPLYMEKKFDWKNSANMILGNTDNTANPSVGSANMVKLLFHCLSAISTKNITNSEMIASTMENTPMTEKYLNFSTLYCNTIGRRHRPTIMAINVSDV